MIGRRSSVLTVVLFGLLMAGVGAAYWRMQTSQRRAAEAIKNVQQCRELATRIQQLRVAPRRADLQSQSATELSRKIETAAEMAGLLRNHIVRIEPREPRRVSDSDYQDQSTDVELRPVTLKQLIAFLDSITRGSGIQVSFVWISSINQFDQQTTSTSAAEPWNVRMTLTNLIYAPKS